MAERSPIEWLRAADDSEGSTWNPIRALNLETRKIGWHCEHKSPGCIGCYSEAMNRWRGTGLSFEPQSRDKVRLFLDEKILLLPLRWRKPRSVFLCSMTDAFGGFVETEWIQRIFEVMLRANLHTYIVTTKRDLEMAEFVLAPGKLRPLPNILLGVSVEDQRRADERRENLRRLAGAGWRTWVSYEPALESVHWAGWEFLNWMVIGGQSGHGARPFASAGRARRSLGVAPTGSPSF